MNRISVRNRLVILFGLILVSCEMHNEKFKPQLNVYCVLKNNVAHQKVIVDRTYDMDEKSDYDLEDVQVILFSNDFCDTLIEDSLYPGLFITRDSFPVIAGDTYHLQVSAKGFDTVSGSTVVPDSFEITDPQNGDTVNEYYPVVFSNPGRNQWFYYLSYYYLCDTLILWKGDFICNVYALKNFWMPITTFVSGSGRYYLVVSAADTNFVEYHHLPPELTPQCGIENGIGMLGSLFSRTINFYYNPQ